MVRPALVLSRNRRNSSTSRPPSRWPTHSPLVIAYHVLDWRQPDAELGAEFLLRRHAADAHVRRLVRQLERLGQQVTLTPAEPPVPTPTGLPPVAAA